ncbi:hypothetical protein OF83DRAFT_1048252 [Amylostereum chailletii]|nr:hypothetical protein OF83DRAFT_1048252 [Amylostereum chailletii]
MLTRAASFEDLATWDDLSLHPIHPVVTGTVIYAMDDVMDLEPYPNYIDPRPPLPEVAEIDETMNALTAQLEALRLKKSELLASNSLIKRLPPEIMSRVFEIGVHECISFLPMLSLVSHHWRAIAVATPSLWSYIRMDSPVTHASFMQRMKVYLQRSQACKILVDIDCRYIEPGPDLQQIMTELDPHLDRCYEFRVSAHDWVWMEVIRSGVQSLGPALEQLYLRLDPSDSEEQPPFNVLSNPCPRLRYVTLEHTPLLCIRTELPSLRALHLIRDQRYSSSSRIGISFKELQTVLTSTPTLEDLRIQSATFLLDGTECILQPSPTITTFPQLRRLSFHYVDTNNLSLFLETARFPALTRLSVQMDTSGDESMQWLGRLSLESETRFPVLRHLDLKSFSTEGAAIVPLIRALHRLPNLTALGISSPPNGHIGGRIFDVLSASPMAEFGGTWILPKLQALCVQNCRDVSGHELYQVAWARNGSGAGVMPIRYIKISQCFSLDPEVEQQLSRLVDTVRVL